MKIMSHKNTFRTFLFTAILFSSCENFLSRESAMDIADSEMFSDAASLENARIGLYNTLQNQYYYGGYYQLIADAYSDNGATGGYDNLDLDEIGYLEASPDNVYLENIWTAIYQTIYAANAILEVVDEIQDPLLTDAVRNNTRGEALAIRAMAHFDLLRMFGAHWDINSPYGIPVILEVLTPLEVRGRNTVAETYDAIITGLQEAESLLTNTDPNQELDVLKGPQFMTYTACKALQARVYRCAGTDLFAAFDAAYTASEGFATLSGEMTYMSVFQGYSEESVFELDFNAQDKSYFNALTYAREDALRSEVNFLADADLDLFFDGRPGDIRADLVDFINNDVSIEPDGRTQKYRGELFQDNHALIFRYAELLLIMAESKGYPDGNSELNTLRAARGLLPDFPLSADDFRNMLMDERRAELNFEGDRYFDLAHFGMVEEILGDGVLPCLPIPNREINASGGLLEQYPGY